MFTQVEVEMEPDEKNVIESSLQEIVSLMDEEEVVLYCKESNSWKYIRELASDDAVKNKETLAYYRSLHYRSEFGRCALSHSALFMWNSLPLSLR